MKASIISFFIAFTFLAFIAAPTVIAVFDVDCDISILLNTNDEEEKEGKEFTKDIEIKGNFELDQDFNFTKNYASSIYNFYSKQYTSNILELTSPPPKLHTT